MGEKLYTTAARNYLRMVSVHGVRMWVTLVRSGRRRVDVPHHGRAVASGQHSGRGQSLLQLFLLLSVLGPPVLKPYLRARARAYSSPSGKGRAARGEKNRASTTTVPPARRSARLVSSAAAPGFLITDPTVFSVFLPTRSSVYVVLVSCCYTPRTREHA